MCKQYTQNPKYWRSINIISNSPFSTEIKGRRKFHTGCPEPFFNLDVIQHLWKYLLCMGNCLYLVLSESLVSACLHHQIHLLHQCSEFFLVIFFGDYIMVQIYILSLPQDWCLCSRKSWCWLCLDVLMLDLWRVSLVPGSVWSTLTHLGVSNPGDSCSNPCLAGQMPVEEEKGQRFGLLGLTTI